jgi:ACS family sodium-dependent inorganic phosphate cotransporter
LTPLAATLSLSALLVTRIGIGMGEAAMFPASYELFGRWAPPIERSRAVAWLYSGVPIGTLVGLMGAGWIVGRVGWPTVFYVFGAAGLLWVIAWFRAIHNDPAADVRVGSEERALLSQALPMASRVDQVPLRRLLLRTTVLAIVAAHVANAWSLYVLLSWLPSYFRDVQGLSIANAGFFSAAPWLAMLAATNLAAIVSDRMIQNGRRLATVRKLMTCFGLGLSALFLLGILEAHSPAAALVLMCVAAGGLGCSMSGYPPSFLDVAPRHGAVLFGFSNTFATIPGIVGVAATGWLVDITGTYSAAFVLTAIVSAVGALTFGCLFVARPVT